MEEDAKNAFAPRCKRGFCFFIFPVAKIKRGRYS